MSETSILPGAGSATQSDADQMPPGLGGGETEAGGDRRRLMIIGGIAGVVVLAAAAYMLLHNGSSPSSTQTFTPTHVAQAPPASSGSGGSGNGSGSGAKPTTLPKKAKQPTVRDPFKPLVEAPVATTGTAPSSTTKVSAAPTSFPTAPVAPVTPTGGSSAPPTSGGTASNSPKWIELKAIHGDNAVFDVGYAHHRFRKFEVQAPPAGSQQGTVFDKIFALIGIQDREVTVQIGDDTPFDLTTGVSHVV